MMSIWQDLQERQNAVADRKITALFDDPNRAEDFSLRTQHMLFDYAKTNIDADARAALEAVCYQTRDLLDAMHKDWKSSDADTVLRVDGGMVEFHVRDSGPGIPEAARDWVFERFAKPVHEKGTQASGTGLGLAITRELALRQDAGIDFTSVTMQDDPQNTGTEFTVTFKETAPESVDDEAVA